MIYFYSMEGGGKLQQTFIRQGAIPGHLNSIATTLSTWRKKEEMLRFYMIWSIHIAIRLLYQIGSYGVVPIYGNEEMLLLERLDSCTLFGARLVSGSRERRPQETLNLASGRRSVGCQCTHFALYSIFIFHSFISLSKIIMLPQARTINSNLSYNAIEKNYDS